MKRQMFDMHELRSFLFVCVFFLVCSGDCFQSGISKSEWERWSTDLLWFHSQQINNHTIENENRDSDLNEQ